MSKLSKKAILSVLTLVLTFVALGATTFAWFTLGTTATVDQFNVEVRGSEGLEISLDDNNWYTRLNSALMKEYIKEQVTEARLNSSGDFVMDAVTTANGTNFFKFSISGNEMVHIDPADVAKANEDFLQLKFKLRTKVNQRVVLSNLGVSSTSKEWTSDQDFTLAKTGNLVESTDKISADLADALRVSVLSTTSHETGIDEVIVFEKEATESLTNTVGTLAQLEGNYIGAFEYYGKKAGFTDEEEKLTLGPTFEPVSATKKFGEFQTELANFNEQTLDEGQEYYTVEVTFNIWFEGYDNEAFDAVLDQMVSIGLAFELVS